MPSIVALALAALLMPLFLVAQEQQVDRRFQVGVDRPVDTGSRTAAAVEPYLAINPDDPKHMVASVSLASQMGDPRQSDGGGGTIACAALASFDAGETWQRHDSPGRSCVDSWIAMLRNGQVVFLAQEGSGNSSRSDRQWRPNLVGHLHQFRTRVRPRFDGRRPAGQRAVRRGQSYGAAGERYVAILGVHRTFGRWRRTFDAKTDVTSLSLPTFPLSPVVMSRAR